MAITQHGGAGLKDSMNVVPFLTPHCASLSDRERAESQSSPYDKAIDWGGDIKAGASRCKAAVAFVACHSVLPRSCCQTALLRLILKNRVLGYNKGDDEVGVGVGVGVKVRVRVRVRVKVRVRG